MKLYYSAGSCSTSCHISFEEAGIPFQAIEIDWDKDEDPNVAEVKRLNPLGTLPVAVLDDGKVLSQNVAIHTYIADQVPRKNLLPPPGTSERAVAMNWLSFVAADLHKSFGPLFAVETITPNAELQGEIREWAIHNVNDGLEYLDRNLAGKDYLMGKQFTVADAYCFVVLGWTKWLQIPTDKYKHVQAYLGRVYGRPSVQKVLKEEGLLE